MVSSVRHEFRDAGLMTSTREHESNDEPEGKTDGEIGMEVMRWNLGPLDNNTYLLLDEATGEAAIVDPTFDSRPIWDKASQEGWRITLVLNTHAHLDHVVENAFFCERSGAPLALHRDDASLLEALPMQAAWMGSSSPAPWAPTRWLEPGEVIEIGQSRIRVVFTPGHSPGSVSFVGDTFAIVGDVLFNGSIGRTDLPGGDPVQLMASIEAELLTLPDSTRVYPGHGPETTIGRERSGNPFLAGRESHRTIQRKS